MPRVLVAISKTAAEQLADLAIAERRLPRDQAAVLLEERLREIATPGQEVRDAAR